MEWDSSCALGIGPEMGGGGDFKIGRWDWDYENRHWADTGMDVGFGRGLLLGMGEGLDEG